MGRGTRRRGSAGPRRRRSVRHSAGPAFPVPDRGAGGAARDAGAGGVTGGSALSGRAIGDASPRDLASSWGGPGRSEEHTSELQSLMRISYADFCLKKKQKNNKD